MAEIALALDAAIERRRRDGSAGHAERRFLAGGRGWSVADVVCTCDATDYPFEEEHSDVCVAIVVAGTFEYRSARGATLLTPGALMLGNPGQRFECSHHHATGDRCLSFWFDEACFERVARDAGATRTQLDALRVAPTRALARLVSLATAGALGLGGASWEELAIAVAAGALRHGTGATREPVEPPAATVARVSRAVRRIAHDPSAPLALDDLAADAHLSAYHFLRTFERLTGCTPHQFVLRTRLRHAALRLASSTASVLDIALDSGFGDVSNFTRTFRAEFGTSPRRFRAGLDRGREDDGPER